MTTFEHRLLLMLSHGEQPASALYEIANDDSRVRRTLKLLQERGWVVYTQSIKMSEGPGAPMKHYKLTEMGSIILHNHEEELEALR